MRSLHSLILFYLLFSSFAYSQDTLYRSNGKIVPVALVKIDSTSITYKQAGDTSSLVYTIDRTFVSKIVFGNGQSKSFAPASLTGLNPPGLIPDYNQDSLRNSLSINLFNLCFGLATINYERFFSSGNFSIKVPLTIRFIRKNTPDESYPDNLYKDVQFSTGCGIFFYPGKSGKTKYYAGASLEFGKNRDVTDYYYNGTIYGNVWVYSALIQSGIAFRLSSRMFISIDAGLGVGIQHYKFSGDGTNQYTTSEAVLDYEGGINIGYKF
jgi:hypothetical protein